MGIDAKRNRVDLSTEYASSGNRPTLFRDTGCMPNIFNKIVRPTYMYFIVYRNLLQFGIDAKITHSNRSQYDYTS